MVLEKKSNKKNIENFAYKRNSNVTNRIPINIAIIISIVFIVIQLLVWCEDKKWCNYQTISNYFKNLFKR